MEEDFFHQNNSFANQTQNDSLLDQTQSELYLSPEETPVLAAKLTLSLEETEILPATTGMLLAQPPIPTAHPKRHRSLLIKTLAIGLLALLLLLTGGSAYAMERPHLPSNSASIRITLNSQQLSKTYTAHATVDSTDPTFNPIGAHRISITTPAKYLTLPATGKKQEPATQASGVVELIGGSEKAPIPANTYDILSYSGVEIEFTVNSPLYTDTPNIPAHAIHPGPDGNIKLYDVNSFYNFPDADTDFFIINRQPFSGGQNASTITVVSQTNINSATSQLTQQLKDGLSADLAALKSKLASYEQFFDPTRIQCQPSVTANRAPDDQASDVTATGTMTCSAIAYTPVKLAAYAANLLQKDAYAQWGTSYTLIGQVQKKLYDVLEQGKTVSFSLDVQGHYASQLSSGMQTHLASLIAGQTQANAQALLLQQADVTNVTLQVSGGIGTALPASPKDIHITIL